jgi:KDO2-lipid IV(A) lauroyltransferase
MLIKKIIFNPLLCFISYLPLSWVRSIGSLVGMISLRLSTKTANRLRNNLLITGICDESEIDKYIIQVAEEFGKTILETICIAWFRDKKHNASLVLESHGLDMVESCIQEGRPILFLTPHIGNFEIALKATAYKLKNNFTVLYKPSKDEWFHSLMLNGRSEDNIKPVPTNSRGVLALVKALKKREFIGILPDSVASGGDGVWVNFFKQKVFATTLAAKMSSFENVATFVVGSRRVKGGFVVDYIPYLPKTSDINTITQEIYTVIENIVVEAKTQYFWSYDRFRVPDHAPKL